ncbi:MAG: hypothetical protein V1731_01555 [Candidatus Aenigmatarchaeota archaeon]
MVANDQVRLLFWIFVFFLVAFMFYTIATYFLPRLIRFQHLPASGERVVDNAEFIEERLAYYACGIWENKEQLGTLYAESLHAKSVAGSVTENGIRAHFTGDCSGIKIDIIGSLGEGEEREVKFRVRLGDISMEFCNRIFDKDVCST